VREKRRPWAQGWPFSDINRRLKAGSRNCPPTVKREGKRAEQAARALRTALTTLTLSPSLLSVLPGLSTLTLTPSLLSWALRRALTTLTLPLSPEAGIININPQPSPGEAGRRVYPVTHTQGGREAGIPPLYTQGGREAYIGRCTPITHTGRHIEAYREVYTQGGYGRHTWRYIPT